VQQSEGGTTGEGEPVADSVRSFDEQAALVRVAGDRELLREIAAIYLDTYEAMVQGVRDAAMAGDAVALKSAAHLFKGTVANFEALNATAVAFELEQMGQHEQTADAKAKAEELAGEAAQLAAELAAYCAG